MSQVFSVTERALKTDCSHPYGPYQSLVLLLFCFARASLSSLENLKKDKLGRKIRQVLPTLLYVDAAGRK